MNGALRHPALQGAAGVGAFISLTWPLLVFDRPVYVVSSFFVIWGAVIALLFVFSRAPEGSETELGDDATTDGLRGDDIARGTANGGGHARGD